MGMSQDDGAAGTYLYYVVIPAQLLKILPPVDKATSELLPSGLEDIVLNLVISDQVRLKSVQQKDAMLALKRRLHHKNPNVQLPALECEYTLLAPYTCQEWR